jgi:hypothetical protein
MCLLGPRTTPPTLAIRRVRWVIAIWHLRPSRHRGNEVGVGGRSRPIAAAWLPGHECSGIRVPPGRRSPAYPTQVLHQKPHTAVLRQRGCVETHILSPSRGRSALTMAPNPSTVNGTNIKFSPLSFAVRPPGQDARNQARKLRVSQATVIKMGVLLGRSPAGKQVLVNWACGVVPSGLPIRGPDMSLDMRLLAVSDATAVSEGSEPMAVGLSGPLGWDRATGPAKTAAYIAPPTRRPSCRLQVAACSPLTGDALAGRGADPSPGAVRRLVGSSNSPELASSVGFTLARELTKWSLGLWPHLQMWCHGSRQAPLATSSVAT